MKRYGRLQQKEIYGPLCQQTLESRLKRELLTNFGFENMGAVADVLIERFMAIVVFKILAVPWGRCFPVITPLFLCLATSPAGWLPGLRPPLMIWRFGVWGPSSPNRSQSHKA